MSLDYNIIALSGFVASGAAVFTMHPIDTIKVAQQASTSAVSNSIAKTASDIWKKVKSL